ncbi:MAG: undecaprenyl-diphosphate phosphatase [Patescibacteria group bacterium]|jgi:undecaprenyl-diphosphatase
MSIIYSILFGLVQGLTEFLPVSSSGHLVILHHFLNLPLADSLAFDVALHLGTLLALLLFFYRDVTRLIKAFFASLVKWDLLHNPDQRLAWMLLVSSIPVFFVGYIISSSAQNYFHSLRNVAIMLIVFGVFFFIYEKIGKKEHTIEQLSWRSTVRIGLLQVLSLIPGVSRSGITIIAGLGEGLKRSEATRFSFLLSLPAVFGAGVKKIYDLSSVGVPADEKSVFVIGFAISAVSGFFCIKYFLRYVQNHGLNFFGWYRVVLGVLLLFWIYIYG